MPKASGLVHGRPSCQVKSVWLQTINDVAVTLYHHLLFSIPLGKKVSV